MKSALDVHQELLAHDVPHEVVRLGQRVLTADDLPRALGIEPGRCVALRCYVVQGGRGAFAAVMVGAGSTPDPAALLDALGATSVRPATADQVNVATDYTAGLVSPVCLPDSVTLLADGALLAVDVLYTALGEGGVALGIRSQDLLAATGSEVARLTLAPGRTAQVIDLDARSPRPTRRSAG